MKIVLTPAEVNHIVATHLVMEGKLEPNIPTDCTWRINQFNLAHSAADRGDDLEHKTIGEYSYYEGQVNAFLIIKRLLEKLEVE